MPHAVEKKDVRYKCDLLSFGCKGHWTNLKSTLNQHYKSQTHMNAVKRQLAGQGILQLEEGSSLSPSPTPWCINDTLNAEKPLPEFSHGEGVQANVFKLTGNTITISDLNILASVPKVYLDKMANKESYQNRIAALYEQSLSKYIVHTTLPTDAALNVEMAQPGPDPHPDNVDAIGSNRRVNNGKNLS